MNTRWGTLGFPMSSQADSDADVQLVARAEFEVQVQASENERTHILAEVADLRDAIEAKLTKVLTALQQVQQGGANGGPQVAGSAGGGAGAPVMLAGRAFGGAPLAHGGMAGFGPAGHSIAFAPPPPVHGMRHVLGNPQLGFGPYGGGGIQTQTQRRMEKLFTDQRVVGWSSGSVRMWWIV
ncbi:unnamed protein product, partial [Pylaiella littoralis]